MSVNPCRECGREPKRIGPSAVGEYKIYCECGNQETFLQAPSALRDRTLAALSEGEKEISDRWNRNNKLSLGAAEDVVITLPDANNRAAGSTVTIDYGKKLTFRCLRHQNDDGSYRHAWDIVTPESRDKTK